MSTPNYTDRERAARALLIEEANRILLANPCLIAAEVQICSTASDYNSVVFVRDHNGEQHCGTGDCIVSALRSAMNKVKPAHDLAAIKREQAARLLADAARLEESAA